MGNASFKDKYNPLARAEEVVKKLRKGHETLRERYLKNLSADRKLMKELIMQGKRDRTLLMLRRKKYIRNELKKLDDAITRMERTFIRLECDEIMTDIGEKIKKAKSIYERVYAVTMLPRLNLLLDSTVNGQRKRNTLLVMLAGNLSTFDELKSADELVDLLQCEFKKHPDYQNFMRDEFYLYELDIALNHMRL